MEVNGYSQLSGFGTVSYSCNVARLFEAFFVKLVEKENTFKAKWCPEIPCRHPKKRVRVY